MAETIDIVRKKFADANNNAGYKVNGRDFQASDIVIVNNKGRPKSGSTVTKKTYDPNYARTTEETIMVDDNKGISKDTKVTTVLGFSQKDQEPEKFSFLKTEDNKSVVPQNTPGGMISEWKYQDYGGNQLQKPYSGLMTYVDKKGEEFETKSRISSQRGELLSAMGYGLGDVGFKFAKGVGNAGFMVVHPVKTIKGLYELAKNPKEILSNVKDDYTADFRSDPLGTSAQIYGEYLGGKWISKGIGEGKDFLKTKYIEKTAKYIPEEELLKPEIIAGTKRFPTSTKVPAKIVEEFKDNIYSENIKKNFPEVKNKDVGFHSTPNQFPKNAEAIPGGSETPGTYVSSSTSKYFLRQGGEVAEPKGNFIEKMAEKSAENIGKSINVKEILGIKREKPTIHPIAVDEVTRIPKNVRKNPVKAQQFFGYEPINPQKPFKKLKYFDESQIKKAMSEPIAKKGKAYVSPQYEMGLKDEIEGIIPTGSEFRQVNKAKGLQRLTGVDTYTKIDGKVVRIKVLEAVLGKSIAKMPKSAQRTLMKESQTTKGILKEIEKNPYEYYNPKSKSTGKPVSAIFSGKAEPKYESDYKISKSSQKVPSKPSYKTFETKTTSESTKSIIYDGSKRKPKPLDKKEMSFKNPEKISYGSEPKPNKPGNSFGSMPEPRKTYSFMDKSNKKLRDYDKQNKKEEQQLKRQSFAKVTGKQEKRYMPTVYSASLGIKGKHKKTTDLTGLEVRPI